MNGTGQLRATAGSLSSGEAMYRVTLSAGVHDFTEAQIRQVVARTRGDLRALLRSAGRDRAQLQLHLGARRIDDVITALEAAGFDVATVIVGQISAAQGAARSLM